MPPRKKKGAPPASPFDAKLDEAEELQQRAERRRGADALAVYAQAAAAFEAALSLTPISSPFFSRLADCRFGLAETLQSWAEGVLAAAAAAPDAQLTPAAEAAATSQACGLFQRAVDLYQTVREAPGGAAAAAAPPQAGAEALAGVRVDALVNAGNALCSWTEALLERPPAGPPPREAAAAMLRAAQDCYAAALAAEEDAATLTNMGDALVQQGELLCEGGAAEEGSTAFVRARECYARACGLSSSEQGDDLPGLLLNWGAGVLAAAGHAGAPAAALPLLDEAAARLRESIAFDRGDTAPHTALGEALVAKSEWLAKGGDAGGAAAAVAAAVEEGYGGALRIQATQTDALVGLAEARAQQAKLAAAAGDATSAAAAWAAAADAYARALAKPEALGPLAQRNDVRYNYACCLAGCGRLVEAAEGVRTLMAAGAVAAADVAADPDLAVLRGHL